MVLVGGWLAVFVFRHAINVPYADDVEDVLQFMNTVAQTSGFAATFDVFFAQFNEHRTIATRVMYWSSHALGGEINFRWLVFITNLALPLVLLMFFHALRGQPYRAWILLPAACVLFGIRPYMVQFWTMSGYAYMYVLAFGFAALLCLRGVTPARFAGAAGFAILATFSLASGQLAWAVGLVSLLHQALVLRSVSWRYPACWALVAVAVLVLYRVGYQATSTLDPVIADVMSNPWHYIAYYLALLGSAFSETNEALAIGGGFVLGLVVAACLLLRWRREDVEVELFAIYLAVSIAAMTAGRAFVTEVSYALSARYAIPSVMLLACVVVLLGRALMTSRPVVFKGQLVLVALALAFWLSTFALYRPDLQKMLQMQVGNFNGGHYWTINLPREESRAIVEESIARGIYRPPARPLPKPDVAEQARTGRAPPKFRQIKQ